MLVPAREREEREEEEEEGERPGRGVGAGTGVRPGAVASKLLRTSCSTSSTSRPELGWESR